MCMCWRLSDFYHVKSYPAEGATLSRQPLAVFGILGIAKRKKLANSVRVRLLANFAKSRFSSCFQSNKATCAKTVASFAGKVCVETEPRLSYANNGRLFIIIVFQLISEVLHTFDRTCVVARKRINQQK